MPRTLACGVAAVAGLMACADGARAEKLSASDEMRSTLRRVVRCATDDNTFFKKGNGVVQILQSKPAGKPFEQLYINIQNCLRRSNYDGRWIASMQFSSELLRGQVYRSIVLGGWGTKTRVNYASDFRAVAAAPRTGTTNPLGAFGVCVAHLDPVNALGAISGPVAGPREVDAYRALGPALSTCVAPGQQIKFSKQVLEGLIAEGLFVARFAAEDRTRTRQQQ